MSLKEILETVSTIQTLVYLMLSQHYLHFTVLISWTVRIIFPKGIIMTLISNDITIKCESCNSHSTIYSVSLYPRQDTVWFIIICVGYVLSVKFFCHNKCK